MVLWNIPFCQCPWWGEWHPNDALPAMGCLWIFLCHSHLTCGATENTLDLDLAVEGIRVKVFTATVPVAKDGMPIRLKGINPRVDSVVDGVGLQDDRVVE